MIRITKEEILTIYETMIETTGGCKGVRDYGLLDSAINSAYQTFDNIEIYPSVEEKAARIGYGIISNHAFLDGNKRMGMVVMLTLLDVNGINIKCTDKDIIKLGLSLASGKAGYDDMLKWIKKHKVQTPKNNIEDTLEMQQDY